MNGIVGSNSAEGMDVHALCLLCVLQVAAFATDCSLYSRVPPDACVSNYVLSKNLKTNLPSPDLCYSAKGKSIHLGARGRMWKTRQPFFTLRLQ